MKREDAISLLRELMASCESFGSAQAVAINKGKETDCWSLSVNWYPYPSESDRLDKIIDDHDLEVISANGRTVFRSR